MGIIPSFISSFFLHLTRCRNPINHHKGNMTFCQVSTNWGKPIHDGGVTMNHIVAYALSLSIYISLNRTKPIQNILHSSVFCCWNLFQDPGFLAGKCLSHELQRVAKVVPRLVGIVENSLGALDFQKSCLFVNRIGNAWSSCFHVWIYDFI
jgi:hypothetical protein